MVIPWLGFPVNKIIKVVPLKDTKYIRFETFFNPEIALVRNKNGILGHMLRA